MRCKLCVLYVYYKCMLYEGFVCMRGLCDMRCVLYVLFCTLVCVCCARWFVRFVCCVALCGVVLWFVLMCCVV